MPMNKAEFTAACAEADTKLRANPTKEVIRDDILKEWFADACQRAQDRSKDHRCTVFVNAQCKVENGLPCISTFLVTDWYASEATLARFDNGVQRDVN